MPIRFRCPKCQALMQVADEAAGHRTACPNCGSICGVPSAPSDSGRPSNEPAQSSSPTGKPTASTAAEKRPRQSPPEPQQRTPSTGSNLPPKENTPAGTVVQLRCPSCKQLMRAPTGTTVKCPHCEATVRAPGNNAPQPAASPSGFSGDDIFPTMPSSQPQSYPLAGNHPPSYSPPNYSASKSSSLGGGGGYGAAGNFSGNPYTPSTYGGGGYAVSGGSKSGQWQYTTLGTIFIVMGVLLILSFIGGIINGVINIVNEVPQPFEGFHILNIALAFVITLPIAIIYIIGGSSFVKRSGLTSAKTVAVVACIPCFNCLILTPFGVWAAILVFGESGSREFES